MKHDIAIKQQQGISLIELLMVVVLIGIMATWGQQSWHKHQQRERLVISARQLLAFLIRLQADANWYNRTAMLWVQRSDYWCIGSGKIPRKTCNRQTDWLYIPPYTDISLRTFTHKEMGFYGKRNTAQAGHFTLANSAEHIRLIISSRGRMRLCSEDKPIAGINLCH